MKKPDYDPQKALLVDRPPVGDRWIHEMKLDGFRMGIFIENERYIISFDKSGRRGKLLIDYKRNYRTSIAVAAFSTRATPAGTMSVPVKWEELGRMKGSDPWNVLTIRDRLKRLKSDP